jgi:predicted transcriptional regulator
VTAESFSSLDDLLHSLNLTGERAQVECKESAWQLPRDVWETVSSFTLTASRALTRLEGLGLLRRSEQRRGPGVYYTPVEDRATPELTSELTPDTKSELLRLMGEGKRLSRDEIATLIVRLCAERPRTARELAEILQRNAEYVRNAYLSPLVREGRLELTGSPNDPNVAYRAVAR